MQLSCLALRCKSAELNACGGCGSLQVYLHALANWQSLVGQCRFKFFSSRAPAELAVPVCHGCGGLQSVCRPAHLHPESPLPQIQETHMNQQVIGAQELIVSIYTHIFTVLLSITCVMILFSSRSMRTIYIRYT